MQDVRVPVPNPFLTQWLVGREARAMVSEVGEIAQAIYRAIGHKESGRSARDARVETHIETVGVVHAGWRHSPSISRPARSGPWTT